MYDNTGPVTRAMIDFNLSDAHEHMGALLQAIHDDPEFGEVEFRLGLAHIYAHLNRAWHQRKADDEDMADPTAHWEEWSKFPTDLEPLG